MCDNCRSLINFYSLFNVEIKINTSFIFNALGLISLIALMKAFKIKIKELVKSHKIGSPELVRISLKQNKGSLTVFLEHKGVIVILYFVREMPMAWSGIAESKILTGSFDETVHKNSFISDVKPSK